MVLQNTWNMLNQAGPYIHVPIDSLITMFTLNIQTDMPEQIMQTQIRLLLLKEQSDQGLHYLLFYRYL